MQEENIRNLIDDFEFKNNFKSSKQFTYKSSTKNKENFSNYLSLSQKKFVQEVI